ncbi:MAG TPA: acyltransferase [Acidimicrobiia bacterium]|nr:acyltransferase [Acidimicrobiia bacterium]
MSSTTASTRPASAPSIDDLVAATPVSRDRAVDFLRALSIVVVVCWHWVFSVTHWNDHGALTMPNPIGDVPGLWLLTWVLQIMPSFFFVGGFANSVAWAANRRKGASTASFLRTRLTRLGTPTAVFAVVWTAFEVVARLAFPSYTGVFHWGFVVFVPLWFLGVYSAVVALAPCTLRLHERAPYTTLAGLAGIVALVDVVRFDTGLDAVGFANVLVVFLFVHQLGYFYGDGTFTRPGSRAPWVLALGGLATMILLTTFGPYPHSMVAIRGEGVSNMFPPNLAVAALGLFQAGLALLLRPALNRWLAHRRPWKVVVSVNAVAMTIFTWHMTAYVAAIALVEVLGGTLGAQPTASWWFQRPLWLALPGVFLAGLLAIFSRYELRSRG